MTGVLSFASRGQRHFPAVVAALAVAALAGCGVAALAGCGQAAAPPAGSPASPAGSPAERVCAGARQAAARALGSPLSARVTSATAYDLRCALTGRQIRVTVDAQPGGQAHTEFETEVAHQEQVYGPLGQPAQIPSVITVPGSVAAVWIRAQNLLVATSARPGTGGVYLTVAVTDGTGTGDAGIAQAVAEAAARAAFAARPGGPATTGPTATG